MTRSGWSLLLLVAAAIAAEEPKLELPEVAAGVKRDPGKLEIVVRVDAGGRVWVDKDGAWRTVTLDGLSTHLHVARTLHHEGLRRHGKIGLDEFGASVLPVTLELDRRVPWAWVRWVQSICSEQKFHLLRLAGHVDGAAVVLPTPLPRSRGVQPIPKEPPVTGHLRFRVHRDAGRSVIEHEARGRIEPAEVAKLAAQARKAADHVEAAALEAVLLVSEQTPADAVLPLVATFHAHRFDRTLCFSTAIPDTALRKLGKLPRPKHDTIPRSVVGSGGFDEELEELEEPLPPEEEDG